MYDIDLERERKRLDSAITFFHVNRARRIIRRALLQAKKGKDTFFIYYFTAQHFIIHEHYSWALIFLKKALNIRPKDGCTYNDIALCFAERANIKRRYLGLIERKFRERIIKLASRYQVTADQERRLELKRKIAEQNMRILECKKIWELYAPPG